MMYDTEFQKLLIQRVMWNATLLNGLLLFLSLAILLVLLWVMWCIADFHFSFITRKGHVIYLGTKCGEDRGTKASLNETFLSWALWFPSNFLLPLHGHRYIGMEVYINMHGKEECPCIILRDILPPLHYCVLLGTDMVYYHTPNTIHNYFLLVQ